MPELKHPCAGTCSGYSQGVEDGKRDAAKSSTEFLLNQNQELREQRAALTKEVERMTTQFQVSTVDATLREAELQRELEGVKAELQETKAAWNLQARFSNSNFLKMDAEIRALKAALEFYADKFTWRSNSGKVGIQPIYYGIENGGDCEMIDGHFTAGYRARQALSQAGERGSVAPGACL